MRGGTGGTAAGRLPWQRAVGLALISAAALACEILLTRLFSIIWWHHFAYMMISIALLGYGAAGIVVALARDWLLTHARATFAASAACFGATAVLAFLLAERIPFNALEFLWDPWQPVWLALVYLVLFVPFFFAAGCICLVFTVHAEQAGRVYACDMLGAAGGSLGVILLLEGAGPLAALGGVGAIGLAAAALAGPRRWSAVLALAAVVVLATFGAAAPSPRISPYKELSQTLEIMGARTVGGRTGPLGQIDVVASPDVPLRHAPGLSLAAPAGPPEQLAVFSDGEGMSAIDRANALRASGYLDYLTSAAAYRLLSRPRVLILGAGSGNDIWQARAHDPSAVTAVELNPDTVDLVERDFADFSGQPYSQPGVRLALGEARGFVAASDERYDLIQIALLDAFGASSAGLYALAESYLYTVEALMAYLERLAPGGYLSITRWVTLPPRDTLKLYGMAVLALERRGITDPGAHIVLVRGWRTVTLLIRDTPIDASALERLGGFCRERSFDLEGHPRIASQTTNRYNRLAQSWFDDGARALRGPERGIFIERYKFDLSPATDDRPYFFHFFRWRSLPELWRLRREGGLPLIEWGYPLLIATLLQAVAASGALIVVSAFRLRRSPAAVCVPWMPIASYFAALGAAFMCIEIAFIQKFMLLLHHPLYAVAVVLCGFLLAAGSGGRVSEFVATRSAAPAAVVFAAVAVIVLLALVYLAVLPALLPGMAAFTDPVRIGVALALIFPLGFAMGMPFPVAMASLGRRGGPAVPWAWAVNACASVVSAVAATVLAIHFGFNAVVLIACALYVLAGVSFMALK